MPGNSNQGANNKAKKEGQASPDPQETIEKKN
jgi:hypothetical protein